jgi:hypothetical protein
MNILIDNHPKPCRHVYHLLTYDVTCFGDRGIPKKALIGHGHLWNESYFIWYYNEGHPIHKESARAHDADAGTSLWLLCLGGNGPDPYRQKNSSLRAFFNNPLFDRNMLFKIMEFVCPNRVPLAKASTLFRKLVIQHPEDRRADNPELFLRDGITIADA